MSEGNENVFEGKLGGKLLGPQTVAVPGANECGKAWRVWKQCAVFWEVTSSVPVLGGEVLCGWWTQKV